MLVVGMLAVMSGQISVEAGPIRPVPFTAVHLTDAFWAPRLETNRRTTVRYCLEKCAETGRIANFARAAGLEKGPFQGIYFNDSDVYKVIEGAAYSLAAHPDAALERRLDDLIATIAAAQQPDGYLNTYYTLAEPGKRWTDLARMHELYCAGHLIEAAVAHFQATGKRELLDVAVRLADHIDGTFGPDRRRDVCGHQEIELALVRLALATGKNLYLDLAKFFLAERGHPRGRALYGEYCQDHRPLAEQDKPVGHAVRAMYMYCGMADVAALAGEKSYVQALDRLWSDMVRTKLAVSGGIGARQQGEAFGDEYELPNASAYNETCAAIGNAMWNQRLALLHGDGRYADVLERIIYNGFLSGVSLDGERFFYVNPLASAGSHHRSPWFDCSCCPVNVVRFLPSIPGFVYAHDGEGIYVNLYAAGTASVEREGGATVTIRQETGYPWDGRIRLVIDPQQPEEFTLRLRIPGWALGEPVPSDLYTYVDAAPERGFTLALNGHAVDPGRLSRGYAVLRRRWAPGDTVDLDLPMPIRRVRAHERVEADRGRVAIERGPIVYCVEAADSGGHVRHLWLRPEAPLRAEHRAELLGGVTVISGEAGALSRAPGGETIETSAVPFTAVPYCVWDNRAPGEMAVFLPESPSLAQPLPAPTLASRARVSASHCYQHDTLAALNDQIEPASSTDHSIPRLTWWDHCGTSEWVQYDFAEPSRVESVSVYWFDDTGSGHCRRPVRWRLLSRDGGGAWCEVVAHEPYGVELDRYNHVRFEPVVTSALRLEVELERELSGGMLEWKLNGQ